jgi:perosamine synthetase
MIPYGRQTIEEDDIEEVVKVLKSDFLTTGPKVAEFERAVAEYVGAKYAVAISNDTAALHAACHAAGHHHTDHVCGICQLRVVLWGNPGFCGH